MLVAYAAHLVRFINFERTKLPEEILRHNLEENRKYFSDICLEVEKSDAEVQSEGVYNQRLQSSAVTLDKGYETITSPPVYISPLDLGPKYTDKLGAGVQEYQKTYGENYCLGQLIFWHNQSNAEPDFSLAKARRGCLSLVPFMPRCTSLNDVVFMVRGQSDPCWQEWRSSPRDLGPKTGYGHSQVLQNFLGAQC